MGETEYQIRSRKTQFETREDGETPHIAGYFAVFDSIYECGPGETESIAPGAFSRSLSGDIRALTNHDSTLVLGRTAAGTLTIREDQRGLWGDIAINPNDSDAMNTWQRVRRGDVSQCSFGFVPVRVDTEIKPDGTVHYTVMDVDLAEISVCTFAAYEETSISARSAQKGVYKESRLKAWRERMKGALKNGPQSPATEEDD